VRSVARAQSANAGILSAWLALVVYVNYSSWDGFGGILRWMPLFKLALFAWFWVMVGLCKMNTVDPMNTCQALRFQPLNPEM
jgi:hypothetical protein